MAWRLQSKLAMLNLMADFRCPMCRMVYQSEKELELHRKWHKAHALKTTLTEFDKQFLKGLRIQSWEGEVK